MIARGCVATIGGAITTFSRALGRVFITVATIDEAVESIGEAVTTAGGGVATIGGYITTAGRAVGRVFITVATVDKAVALVREAVTFSGGDFRRSAELSHWSLELSEGSSLL